MPSASRIVKFSYVHYHCPLTIVTLRTGMIVDLCQEKQHDVRRSNSLMVVEDSGLRDVELSQRWSTIPSPREPRMVLSEAAKSTPVA